MIRVSQGSFISLWYSDEDAKVDLDDVWFAYPSRPNDMVLKVIQILFISSIH